MKGLFKGEADIEFIGRMGLFGTVSGIMVVASIVLTAVLGLNFGIDFAGGTEMQVLFEQGEGANAAALRDVAGACGVPDPSVVRYGETEVEVDVCPVCRGIWLDQGEFENVLSALEDEVARMPARELLAAALHEAAEVGQGRASLATEWKHSVQILNLLKLRVLVGHPALRRLLIELEGTPFG